MSCAASSTPPTAVAQPFTTKLLARHGESAIFLGQVRGALRGREGSLTLAAELVSHAGIVKRMAESIGMTERLGERNSLPSARLRPQRVAGQLQCVRAHHVGADTRVVTAEGMT
jgi:hypothetical protein